MMILLFLVAFIICCILYSFYEYKNIKVKTIEFQCENVTHDLNDLKILYVSDFQLDISSKKTKHAFDYHQMEKVIDLINQQHPDLILLGGDYINYGTYAITLVNYLNQLSAPLGIYGVLGNHDLKHYQEVKAAFNNSSIKILENELIQIKNDEMILNIAAVEDMRHGNPSIESYKSKIDNHFTILLTHNPDFFNELSSEEHELFDLTLAGHTHAGQITYFGLYAPIIPSKYNQRYRYGMIKEDNHLIYVSSGIGGSVGRFRIRFFAPPEIVVIRLKQST